MDLENLKLLETRINQFVDEHQRVREEQESLQERLKNQEVQLAQMATQLQQYERERVEIRARLGRILSRLEGLG